MTEYQALRDEIGAAIHSAFYPGETFADKVWLTQMPTDAVMPIVRRELAARDAVIEQIRALAEAFYRDSEIAGQSVGDARAAVRSARCASDIERILSALPSTEEATDES